MSIRSILSCTAAVVFLGACSEPSEPQAVTTNVANNEAAVPTDFYTGITIREIMDSLIDPHADTLWNSVRVVSDATGIHEYAPESAEDWAAMRISAVSIIEGTNALMVPGRRVAPPGATGEFPEYEYTPEEVQVMLDADRLSWVGFARGLQNAAREVLGAIDKQDAEGLSNGGAIMDEACEACHSHYWYRAGI